MYKILPILIIGIFVLSGLGAVAFPEDDTDIETQSIYFSNPTIVDQNDYLNIKIKEANSFIIKEGKPLLPSYVQTFTFPIGTKIEKVFCEPKNKQFLDIDNKLIIAPKPVILEDNQLIFEDEIKENPKIISSWYSYDRIRYLW